MDMEYEIDQQGLSMQDLDDCEPDTSTSLDICPSGILQSTAAAQAPSLPKGLPNTLLTLSPSTPSITRSLSKSTPRDPISLKHPPPTKIQVKDRAEDDIAVHLPTQSTSTLDKPSDNIDESLLPNDRPASLHSCSPLEKLPAEILEAIAGYVGGQLGSAESRNRALKGRNWNTILRHPRRKDVSDLALVSPLWRRLVQERVFRHIKIQGTQAALQELGNFFIRHQHLQVHVKHLQVIVPIWEMRKGGIYQRFLPSFADLQGSANMVGTAGVNFPQRAALGGHDHQADSAQMFRLASSNASVAEIFATARILFPALHAVTLEAGHSKKSPQIKLFPNYDANQALPSPSQISFSKDVNHKVNFTVPSPPGPYLPALPTVKVLIFKGAWNVIRQASELSSFHQAIPHLQELHCTYHAPKTDSYTIMCSSLRPGAFPRSIRHLNICLEGLYAKNVSSLAKWRKVYPTYHICRDIGAVFPQLESLTYTGRLCGALFSTATKAAETCLTHPIMQPTSTFTAHPPSAPTRLRRIDIILQNICRDVHATTDTTGIHNFPFIQAFEILVCQALRCLQYYTNVQYLRIRFIDFDSPDPLLNPKFQMEGNRAWGIYSEDILSILRQVRPEVTFEGARYFGGGGFGQNESLAALNLDLPMIDAPALPSPFMPLPSSPAEQSTHQMDVLTGTAQGTHHHVNQNNNHQHAHNVPETQGAPPSLNLHLAAQVHGSGYFDPGQHQIHHPHHIPHHQLQSHRQFGRTNLSFARANGINNRSHSIEFYAKMAQSLSRQML